jgi:hypothetical protein
MAQAPKSRNRHYGCFHIFRSHTGFTALEMHRLDWVGPKTTSNVSYAWFEKRRATPKRDRVRTVRRKLANRTSSWKTRQNSILLNEMQASGCVLFPTEIVNYPNLSELGSDKNFDDDLASTEIVSPEYLPPEVEYWTPAARKDRAKAALQHG